MNSRHEIIDITPSGDISFTANVNSFLKALNPLGAISDTVGKIVACRVQMKRLKNDTIEIKRDYDARNKMIDGTLKYAMLQIENQREGMEKYFQHASKQLELSRIYSSERVRVIQSMTKLMTDANSTLEVKQLAAETIKAMSTDLIASQQAGSTTLSALVQSANQNLLAVPSLAGLLPENKR